MITRLITAVRNLRQAQQNYMADRGNDELGKAVGAAAAEVDEALNALDPARLAAYAAIDSERAYQEMRIVRDGSTAVGEHHHSPEEFLLYMDHYLGLAKGVASTVWGPECKPAIQEIVRKVTTLGVASMELNGAPQREGFEQ